MIQRHALGNMIQGPNEFKLIPPMIIHTKTDDQTSLGEISSLDSLGELSQDIDATISRAQEVVRKAKTNTKASKQENTTSPKSEKGSMVHAEQDLSLSSVSDR